MEHPLLFLDEVDSTNEYVKRNLSSLADGAVVRAGHQTAGKGRLGRKWSDGKDSLLFSLLLKSRLDPARVSLLPLLAGAAVYKMLEKNSVPAAIKWPNDVLLDGRKCCGILVEGISQGSLVKVVLGIGLNLNTLSFPEELASKATSLRIATGKTYDPALVLDEFLAQFDPLYEDYLAGKDTFLTILKAHSFLDGKKVLRNYYGEGEEVVVLGIQDDGRLLVRRPDGKEESLSAGEVTLSENYSRF
jgi:BirA family biotin operon repressor/biotin-[acetyl-CoA-carboxylase] ligase